MRLTTKRQFIMISLSFAFYFSNVLVLSVLIDEIVETFDFTRDQAGFFGAMGVLGGFFGMLILGVFLNKTHKYRVANIMIGFSTILSLTILLIVLYSEIKILVTIAYIVFGFC